MKDTKEVQLAKEVLKNNGYYVENLWSIQDIQNQHICSDEIAYEILGDAIEQDGIYEAIHDSINLILEWGTKQN